MIKIRLMRIGAKQKPFYRVVAVDERAKRTGAYVELLGTYNPLTEPKEIKLKQDRVDYWIKQGAQPSTGYLRMIGKAPQRPPRKPKKESKQEAGTTEVKLEEAQVPTEEKAKETPAESVPAEANQSEPEAASVVEGSPEEVVTQKPDSKPKETSSGEKEVLVDDSTVQTQSEKSETPKSKNK